MRQQSAAERPAAISHEHVRPKLDRWIGAADQIHRLTANAFAQAREDCEFDMWDWRALTEADAEFADRLLEEIGITGNGD